MASGGGVRGCVRRLGVALRDGACAPPTLKALVADLDWGLTPGGNLTLSALETDSPKSSNCTACYNDTAPAAGLTALVTPTSVAAAAPIRRPPGYFSGL